MFLTPEDGEILQLSSFVFWWRRDAAQQRRGRRRRGRGGGGGGGGGGGIGIGGAVGGGGGAGSVVVTRERLVLIKCGAGRQSAGQMERRWTSRPIATQSGT